MESKQILKILENRESLLKSLSEIEIENLYKLIYSGIDSNILIAEKYLEVIKIPIKSFLTLRDWDLIGITKFEKFKKFKNSLGLSFDNKLDFSFFTEKNLNEFKKIPNLTSLSFWYCNLDPDFDFKYSNIFSVDFHKSNVKSFNFLKDSKISSLTIEDMDLREIPKEIFELDITSLILKRCKLTTIPKEIINLKRLNYLNLNENEISEIPSELLELNNLKRISLNFNKFTKIPKELVNMNKIENINISNNPFEQNSDFEANAYELHKKIKKIYFSDVNRFGLYCDICENFY